MNKVLSRTNYCTDLDDKYQQVLDFRVNHNYFSFTLPSSLFTISP